MLKKGLMVNAVDPSIGGVLLRGEKGTGKTTAVRSFAAVLPPKDVVSGCRFGCVRGTSPCDECRAREASGEVLRYESRPVEVVDLALNASVRFPQRPGAPLRCPGSRPAGVPTAR